MTIYSGDEHETSGQANHGTKNANSCLELNSYDPHAEILHNDIGSQKLVLQAESLQLNEDTSHKL